MLQKLRNCLKIWKNNKTIFDIVLYGSAVKGKDKPNDIDIMVIFKNGSLKDRLANVQGIKKVIKLDLKLDVKQILWDELFKPEFFAKSGIFFEGISIFDGQPFSKKIDFDSRSLFIYSLKDKSHTQKVKFNYLLSGRNGIGIVEGFKGKHLAPGVIQIPVNKSLQFEEILNLHEIKHSKRNILIQMD